MAGFVVIFAMDDGAVGRLELLDYEWARFTARSSIGVISNLIFWHVYFKIFNNSRITKYIYIKRYLYRSKS